MSYTKDWIYRKKQVGAAASGLITYVPSLCWGELGLKKRAWRTSGGGVSRLWREKAAGLRHGEQEVHLGKWCQSNFTSPTAQGSLLACHQGPDFSDVPCPTRLLQAGQIKNDKDQITHPPLLSSCFTCRQVSPLFFSPQQCSLTKTVSYFIHLLKALHIFIDSFFLTFNFYCVVGE